MGAIGIPHAAKYNRARDRQYLINGLTTATAVGDFHFLDTAALGKVTDQEGTVVTGTDYYKTRQGVNADVYGGIGLIAMEVIPAGKPGWFLEVGEHDMNLDAGAIVAGSDIGPSSISGTLTSTGKLLVATAAGAKIFAKAKEATAGAAGLFRVEFDGRNGFGSFGTDT